MHRTWARPEAAELAKLYTIVAPNYAALIELREGLGRREAEEVTPFLGARPDAPVEGPPLYSAIVLTGLAMGVRSATVRKLAVPDLTTTVLTLTITGLAADSSLAGGSNPGWLRRGAGGAALGARRSLWRWVPRRRSRRSALPQRAFAITPASPSRSRDSRRVPRFSTAAHRCGGPPQPRRPARGTTSRRVGRRSAFEPSLLPRVERDRRAGVDAAEQRALAVHPVEVRRRAPRNHARPGRDHRLARRRPVE